MRCPTRSRACGYLQFDSTHPAKAIFAAPERSALSAVASLTRSRQVTVRTRTSVPGTAGSIGVQPHPKTKVVSGPAPASTDSTRRIISSSEWPSRLMACAGHCDAQAPHAWQVSASK